MWDRLTEDTVTILLDGGWLMIPLALLALLIYGVAFRLFFYFSQHPFYRSKRENWAKWVMNPVLADGEIRQIIDYTQEEVESINVLQARFADVNHEYLTFPDQMHRLLLSLVTVAPLMGLLGTVTGMLTTFAGLAASRGGDTIDQIAGGISEALITTQTGLIIAIPGYVIAWAIQKRRNEMHACLSALETMTTQLYVKSNPKGAGRAGES